MNYALKNRHYAVRQTLCFLFGHKWKYSGSHKTEFYGLDYDNVPYSVRKRSGNHMFESNAWWAHKCTRCRLKLRDGHFPTFPWYVDFYRAMEKGIRVFHWTVRDELFNNDLNKSLKRRIIAVPLIGILFGFEIFWLNMFWDSSVPNFPGYIASDIHCKLSEWLDKE